MMILDCILWNMRKLASELVASERLRKLTSVIVQPATKAEPKHLSALEAFLFQPIALLAKRKCSKAFKIA